MRTVTETLLRELGGHDAPICVSLFLEVTAGGGDHKLIRLSLKNAQSEASEALQTAGVGDDNGSAAVQERLDALDYGDLAGAHDRRVAVFLAPDLTEVVDARFTETQVHVGPLFRLSPLLGDLEHTPEHAILLASQEEARLYRSSKGQLTLETVDGMPGSLSDVSKYTDQQEKGNIHGREDSGIPGSYKGPQAVDTGVSGTQGVPHHSMGGHDWREDKEHDLRRYANLLINAAAHHLSGSNMLLVIAADERLHGMIRENSEYPFLADEGIFLHPTELDQKKLREEAAACVQRQTVRRRQEAWDRIAMSLGRDDHEAGKDAAEIVTASAAGRVAHLFVRAGATLMGQFDKQSLAAETAEEGPENLVDRAIVETLRNGGDVFPLGDYGDESTVMAAAYRYPT